MNKPRTLRHSLLCLTILLLTLVGGTLHADQGLESLLETKVSTASKYSQYIRTAPASVTVVTAEEIDRFGYQTLLEVFNHVPGFHTSTDRNYNYVGVRGLGRPSDYNTRIAILLNGQLLNETFYGGADPGYEPGIPLSELDRIEIVRGPGSALYGSGAMFAVVNLILREPRHGQGIDARIEGGNLGTSMVSAVGAYADGDLSVLAGGQWFNTDGEDLYFEEFDSPETDDGRAIGLDWEESTNAFAAMRWGNLEIQAYFNGRDKGVPTAAYGTIFGDPRFITKDDRTHVALNHTWKLGTVSTLRIGASIDDYSYSGGYPYEYLDNGLWTEFQDSRWWRISAEYVRESERNQLVAGLEYVSTDRADFRAFEDGDPLIAYDIPFETYSAFVHDSVQILPNLSITAGLRFDDYSDVGSSMTPRLAIVYSPSNRLSLKAMYGEAFRRPNHFEAYYDDLDYQKPNPDLKPEEIKTFELAVEGQINEVLTGWVSAYRWDIDNLITQVVDPADDLSQFQNIDAVKSEGFEVGLKASFDSGAWATLSLSRQEGIDKTKREPLSNSPETLARLGVLVPVSDRVFLGAQYRWEDTRLTVAGTETDAYQILDLHLTTDEFFDYWRFSLHVKNALDEEYAAPGGFEHEQVAIPQFGRTYRIGVEFVF